MKAAAAAAKDGMQSLPAVTFSSKLFVKKKEKEKKKQKNLICFSSKRKSQVADSPGLWALAPYRTSHECCFVALKEKNERKKQMNFNELLSAAKRKRKILNSQKSSTSSNSLSNSIRLH